MKVAVIGSGLSAIAAVKTLIERGIKPIILDYGLTLNQEKEQIVTQLAQQEPNNWNYSQQDRLV